jgi:hypothetical protein
LQKYGTRESRIILLWKSIIGDLIEDIDDGAEKVETGTMCCERRFPSIFTL